MKTLDKAIKMCDVVNMETSVYVDYKFFKKYNSFPNIKELKEEIKSKIPNAKRVDLEVKGSTKEFMFLM